MNSGNPRAIEPFRLVQLSDCHLSADPAADYRGVNAEAGLRSLAAAVSAWRPDAVLLTGDVSEDASAASYARASALLAPLAGSVLALPGNHDHPQTMRAQFPRGPWEGPLAVAAGAWQIVLLDSCVEGRVDGRLDGTDIEWLDRWLRNHARSPVLLALHHHPVAMGSPWIDRYALENPDALLHLVDAHAHVRCVAWGHVHQDFATDRAQARLQACPSTAANSLPHVDRFALDPAGPAGRWLELDRDGSLRTGLLRAAAPGEVSGAAAPATG